jgi:Tfp pilus assembly protein PilO
VQKREKYLLISFAVLLGIVLVWYLVWPTYVRYTQLEEEIRSNVQKIQSAQREAAQIEELVDNLVETKKELKVARQKLPDDGRFNQLMSTLEEQALQAGIPERNIVAFNRGSLSEAYDGLLQEMTIKAQFQSMSMVQLTDALWRFNQMRRLVDVQNFSMERAESDGTFPRYNVNLTLAVYTLETDDEEAAEA